jgi:hypothetical protein
MQCSGADTKAPNDDKMWRAQGSILSQPHNPYEPSAQSPWRNNTVILISGQAAYYNRKPTWLMKIPALQIPATPGLLRSTCLSSRTSKEGFQYCCKKVKLGTSTIALAELLGLAIDPDDFNWHIICKGAVLALWTRSGSTKLAMVGCLEQIELLPTRPKIV